MHRVAVGVALALVAGMLAGADAPSPRRTAVLLLACACCAAVIAWRASRPRLVVVTALAGTAAAGVAIGWSAQAAVLGASVREAAAPTTGSSSESGERPICVITGRLAEDAAVTAVGVGITLHASSLERAGIRVPVHGKVRVAIGGELSRTFQREWRAGRVVTIPVLPRAPQRYRNPGIPDQELALARRGISLIGVTKSGALLRVTSPGAWYEESAARVRDYVRTRTARLFGAGRERSAAVVTAILIGDRAGLNDELRDQLQRAGTFHVIAISGGNIAVLAAVCLGSFRLLGTSRRFACLASAFVLAAYSALVQGGPSVARATVMALVWLVARAMDHRVDHVSLLGSTAALLAVASPLTVFDAGFALTCVATLGILAGVPRAMAWTRDRCGSRRPGWLRAATISLAGVGATTVCAELAVFPISVLLFSLVTVAGLPLNFVAVPAMSVIQVAGLAAVCLGAVHEGAARICAAVAHLGVEALVGSAATVDLAPWLAWRAPRPSVWPVLAYYIGLLLCVTPGAVGRLRIAAGVVVLASAAAIAGGLASLPQLHRLVGHRSLPPTLTVTVLDVGQGDATLVDVSGAEAVLVDAGGIPGGGFDIGARIVGPALWALGVRRLGALVLTHGDPDHIGGASAIIRDFRPASVWEGVAVTGHAPTALLRDQVERLGGEWRNVRAGETFRLGDVRGAIWHPPEPDWERRGVRNDDSVVLELRIGRTSIVLPGDAGQRVEESLLGVVGPAEVRVLKAGHHGSAGSTSAPWLRALEPQAVIVSAGRANRFGHPAPAVLARAREAGALVLRTDELGAIQVVSDGRSIVIRSWTGGTWADRARLVPKAERKATREGA